MKTFILKYWLSLALLFTVFYWEESPFSTINYIQTNFTVYLTSLTLPIEMISGDKILISSTYVLVIEKECNAIVPYLFFLASILAFPSPFGHKVKWIFIGYASIVSINIFRIWLVTQLVLNSRDNFSLAHDYIGNIILIITSLLLFTLFVKNLPRKRDRDF